MKRTISFNPLDPDSIDNAIKEIENYIEFVEEKARELVIELTAMGKMRAVETIPVRTGTAMSSIDAYLDEDGNKGIIRAGGYCAFIEFGTGVRGLGSPHPSAEYIAVMNWAYNIGATIFTTRNGKTGWYYPVNDERTEWRFTEGMPSRPFMYQTAQYLKKEAEAIARELFES